MSDQTKRVCPISACEQVFLVYLIFTMREKRETQFIC